MQVRNFLFHRVSEEKDKLWPPMTPQLFESIVKLLISKFNVVSLEKFMAEPNQFNKSKKDIATILFDDGFKDNILYAAPILKKYNCPASFYVVTQSIDKGIPTWTYQLDEALQKTKQTSINIPFDYVPKRYQNNSLSDINVAKSIKIWLKSLPNKKRIESVAHILKQCEDVNPTLGKMMSWNDIRQLLGEGFEIGSHTHTHAMLALVESEDEIRNELGLSSQRIIEETGKKPLTISYPIGSYDERVIKIAKECGYKWGLAVEQKFFKYNVAETMAIPRMELYQEPIWKAYLRINGIYNRVRSLWS